MSSTGAKSQTISPQSNDGSNEATGSIITPPSGKGKHEEGSGGIQLRTSARVSKKLKLEAEAAAQIQPDPKKESVEDKKPPEPEKPLKKRAHELWSSDDKNTFFEALNEYGKDFDAIAKYMMSKVKKKGGSGDHASKTRAQVRCFYYRTWHKIAKHLNFPEGIQKLTQELYGLINFGEMRKKCGVITVKNCIKLNELIYGGITQIRIKGKSLRVRTPNCRAMRKINQVMDSEEDKIPSRIVVEFLPKDKSSWHAVQGMAMNPRVRTTVTNHTKVATLLNYLQNVKWKLTKGMLRVAPPADATISLPSVKRNESNASSHSAFSLLNHEKKFGSPALVSSIHTLLNQIRHSTPGNRKRQRADSSSDKSKLGAEPNVHETEKKEGGGCYDLNLPAFSLPVFSTEQGETVSDPSAPLPSSSVASLTGSGGTPVQTISPNKEEHGSELPQLETVLQGWTLDNVHNTQVGHLYSMFGNEGKVVLTYCWEDVKPEFNLIATLQHMLLVAKLVLNKNVNTSGQSCPCGHTCDKKPNLTSSENTAAKAQSDTFKRPKPIVEPQDEFQAQLDKFQPKSYKTSKRFRSKNLIVHRVHPLNTPPLSSGKTLPPLPSSSPSPQYIPPPSSMPVISHVNDPVPAQNSLPSSTTGETTNQSSLATQSSGEAANTDNLTRSANSSCNNSCDFLGNLMDTSLSSSAANNAVAVLDELMEISFPHSEVAGSSSSPSSFSGLIPSKEDSISLPSSPSKLLKEGENKWLSSEVGDYSLSSLLGHLESPAKPCIPSDMQSMISESSVDYMAKFADLAAQMANDETCKN